MQGLRGQVGLQLPHPFGEGLKIRVGGSNGVHGVVHPGELVLNLPDAGVYRALVGVGNP